MIKENELRVGNWVIGSDAYFAAEIKPYQVKGFDLYGGRYDYFEPIPLTPDILKKCGFMRDRNGWNLPSTQFSLTDKFYPCWLDRMLWPQDINDFREQRLNYLHQLQNLYFALTAKELEIKL